MGSLIRFTDATFLTDLQDLFDTFATSIESQAYLGQDRPADLNALALMTTGNNIGDWAQVVEGQAAFQWNGSIWVQRTTANFATQGAANTAYAKASGAYKVNQSAVILAADVGFEQVWSTAYGNWRGNAAGGSQSMIVPSNVTGTLPGTGSATILPSGRTTFTNLTKLFLGKVFTLDFESYDVEIEIESMAADQILLFGLASSGSQAAGADYNYTRASAVGTTWAVTTSTTQTTFSVGRCSAAGGIAKFTIANPALAKKTRYSADSQDMSLYREVNGGYHNLANPYDGLVFTPATTAVNGWITIKGNPL